MRSAPTSSSPLTLAASLRGGLILALLFGAIAAVIMVGAGLRGEGFSPLALPLVVISYAVMGTLGGMVFWALRAARRNVLGWAITGAVISALTYGSIGAIGIIGFYAGANVLGLKSAAEGWSSIPTMMLITALFPGIPLGVWFWFTHRQTNDGTA